MDFILFAPHMCYTEMSFDNPRAGVPGFGPGWQVAMTPEEPDHETEEDDDEGDADLMVKTRPKTKKPSLYKVLLLNDDYTPMEFVIEILEAIFGKSHEEATRIMLQVHNKGVGVCGVYTYEIAETKVSQTMDYARQHQHPLQCTMEKE